VSTKSAIFYWASLGVKEIVVADATGDPVLSSEDEVLLREVGCVIERVRFQQDDDEAIRNGKGYAEGKLIEFTLQNSKILDKSTSFYKCTGKVFCRNFHEINASIVKGNIVNLFWVGSYTGTIFNYVDLRFFLCEKKTFFETLLPGYLAATADNDYVELLITPRVRERFNQAKFVRPKLTGFSGGSNDVYPDIVLGDLEFQFPCFGNAQKKG